MKPYKRHLGVILAVLSAVLFGISTPLAKLFLNTVDPWMMAGLLYFGSGIGLLIFKITKLGTLIFGHESPLRGKDWFYMTGVIFFGGIVAPVFMMYGLAATPASNASLLINLEGLATSLLAFFLFREHIGGRIFMGMIAILLGCIILSWTNTPTLAGLSGTIFIVFACLAWGLDNNLTRSISAKSPLTIAIIKSLAAGFINLTISVAFRSQKVEFSSLLWIGLTGFLGYGVSLVFFITALRHLGASRTSAYFSMAPFIGAGSAFFVSGDILNRSMIGAFGFMAFGIYLHITEDHNHEHEHEVIRHDHRHIHDEHHLHKHDDSQSEVEPHSHSHTHQKLRHSHRHYPDIHHRHQH